MSGEGVAESTFTSISCSLGNFMGDWSSSFFAEDLTLTRTTLSDFLALLILLHEASLAPLEANFMPFKGEGELSGLSVVERAQESRGRAPV